MLPRPSTSFRRLKHHLTTSFECVWISEEDPHNAFQRFCGASNTIRRHGSSVPGPMESRRRLGRRRMAHVTEMTQAPMYDLGALWCSSWGPEKIESQWKAPTPRISEQPKQSPILPSWLTNWTPVPEQLTDISTEVAEVEESTEDLYDMLKQERQIKDHFYDFEVAIEAHRRECTEMKRDRKAKKNKGRHRRLVESTKALKLCLSFGEKLQQSLTLGLVTSDLLSKSLRAVTNVFMEIGSGSFSDTKNSTKEGLNTEDCFRGVSSGVTEQIIAFHKFVWDGIVSCKVLEPADFDSGVVGEYLLLLAALPSTKETQLLISEVLPSLSAVQVESNVVKILPLLNKWSLSWLKKSKNPPDARFLAKAEASLIASQRAINHIRMLMWSNRGKETPELIQRILDIFLRSCRDFSVADNELWCAESIFMPHSHSIDAMSTALAALSKEVTSTLIRSHSELICSATFWDQRCVTGLKDYLAQSHRIRFNWLTVLSKLGNVDDSMFAEVFISLQQKGLNRFGLDTKKYTLTWRQVSELVLNRWSSQGILTNGGVIIDTFQMKTLHSPFSFGWLLWSLEKYGQLSDGMIQSLLDFLLDVEAFGHIHAVLKQSKMFNIRVNTDVLAGLVNSTASVDLQAAYNIYMQHCVGRVEPEACASLFAAMVYHGSEGIWTALDAPIYAAMPKWKRKSPSHKILSQARIELVHELAKAFAHHKVENPRQALRNVTQCWHYLRAHKVEPTSEISRAVTRVGIITDVRDGKWGRTERVRWVLEVIEKAEGPEVADAVRRAVAKWREKLRIRLEKKKEGYIA
ncbi:2f6460c3-4e06-47d9-9735-4e6b909ab3cf-CDS [Sclerotinia trifoliorum]|uniref:2f6460c3-4e06-47d9-9735-4e6b909ab3cf-CDS n=1 Tax=Sclerotinia trifoliorum TaxID=28548 RepID=A0A8H2VX85_9HELO|nr:2f6460c3-4e06-47d9-9735-4e6b909ab3cf-CDS [Sclerotinia trifoliorum]